MTTKHCAACGGVTAYTGNVQPGRICQCTGRMFMVKYAGGAIYSPIDVQTIERLAKAAGCPDHSGCRPDMIVCDADGYLYVIDSTGETHVVPSHQYRAMPR